MKEMYFEKLGYEDEGIYNSDFDTSRKIKSAECP